MGILYDYCYSPEGTTTAALGEKANYAHASDLPKRPT